MIRRIVETLDDQILEVVKLYDRNNEPIECIDLAQACVIRGVDGGLYPGEISTLAIHTIQ